MNAKSIRKGENHEENNTSDCNGIGRTIIVLSYTRLQQKQRQESYTTERGYAQHLLCAAVRCHEQRLLRRLRNNRKAQ